jgi:hypothetical protein
VTDGNDYEDLWADVLERHPLEQTGDEEAWAAEVIDDWIAELKSRGESEETAVALFNTYLDIIDRTGMGLN